MRRYLLLVLTCIFAITLSAQDFIIKNFEAEYFLHPDGYFDAVEKYDVEFFVEHHGIYRNIETTYKIRIPEEENRVKGWLKISDVEVPDHKFRVSALWRRRTDNEVEIKIGDKKKLVNGLQHYEIRYRVKGAFVQAKEGSSVQFYWNVKPPNWKESFEKISFRVHLPEGLDVSSENAFVYAGTVGESSRSQEFAYDYSDGVFTAESDESFHSRLGEAVTVLVKMPEGSITVIPGRSWVSRNGWIPLLILIMGSILGLWWKFGKDDKVIAVTSYYPPEDLDPAAAVYFMSDFKESGNLPALIPYWASKGLLSIEEITKRIIVKIPDLELTKLKELPEGSKTYEHLLFDYLFSEGDKVRLSEKIKKPEYRKVFVKAAKELKKSLRPYYYEKSEKLGQKLITVGLISTFIITVICFLIWGMGAAFVMYGAFIIILVLALLMKKKNAKGNEAYASLLGFRNFVKLAETGRIERLLKEDPRYFDETMPYAFAFGLLKKWSTAFETLPVSSPSWYSSSSGISSMKGFSNSFSSAMTSGGMSGSGGGSAGGGAGGGGGGGW